jgi:oleate hydratase
MTDTSPNLDRRVPQRIGPDDAKVYLVGGGIASMAAAAFMIRDGDVRGRNITILEETDRLGGSLDGAGSALDGYVLRGGRMVERKYLCTYDLFSSIPTLDESKSVTQEIFDWNETMKTSSKSRLVREGHREVAPKFGLSEAHILTIERLAIEPEAMLGRASIADEFDAAFFETNFWFMWCTTFAFSPGTAPSSSSAISCASRIWSQASTASKALCGRSATSMIPWSGRCTNGWTRAAWPSS